MTTLAILGCGRIGQVHAGSLLGLPGTRIGAVSDAVPAAAEALSARTGAPVRTADQVMSDPEIAAVIVATPTDTHFDLIHAAAEAGKAVFCEKPVDMSANRIRTCIDAVEKSGIAFMTGFNRRFDTSFAHLRGQLRAGAIGAVEIVTISSRDPAPPPLDYIAASGGIFRDMMIHDFDMARFLLEEEPVQVFATGAALVDPAIGQAGDVDTAAAILTTASGRICQISNSRRAAYGYDQRVEVHGADGMLRVGNIRDHSVEAATGSGFTRAPAQHFFLERYRDAYLAEMAHFVDALREGCPPQPTIHDGLRAQLLADAAALSLESGTPVRL
ncbi:inositol 2-dehydrogenase [Jannaschia sp. S6380]|uniref:inositol 2-dehydrogenase n=1 Tax=Jannaschia sp. S6380 TaxID=2926408 RepID=UPI001FF3E730|nr:inositol 2-dehydrogenase [Jannaschia sp. S6380]MCK0167320.1 inositol 2-dehydrogenase [Jannaschia sp. S6380]